MKLPEAPPAEYDSITELHASFASNRDFSNAVNEAVIKLCEENPEYQYANTGVKGEIVPDAQLKGCSYSQNFAKTAQGKDCGCIFGRALANIGLSLIGLIDLDVESDGISNIARGLGMESQDLRILRYKESTFTWSHIQSRQDIGMPWGKIINV